MTESIYERINKILTWKRIIAFNFVLLLVLIVPLSVRLSQQDTELRSNAAGDGVIVASPTPIPNYPQLPPQIDRVSTFYGKTGDSVIILGSNFGNYQWGSKVYVGNVEALQRDIVRWSNGVVEVQIPEGARTGNVWIAVNDQQSYWEGKLLLYQPEKDIMIGMSKISTTESELWIEKADNLDHATIEISYITEPITISSSGDVVISNKKTSVDILGKKMKFDLVVKQQLPRTQTQIATITHPQVGTIEIIRVELFDSNNNLLNTYSNPLGVKISP
ncbi:MAG: IPT/TIG domain-containing protein [bacterium]